MARHQNVSYLAIVTAKRPFRTVRHSSQSANSTYSRFGAAAPLIGALGVPFIEAKITADTVPAA
jgi:hypothetical protein